MMYGSMTRPNRIWFLCILAASTSGNLLPGPAHAQDPPKAEERPAVASANDLTIENVQARLKKLEDNKDLDSALKTKLIEAYTKSLEHLRAAAESAAQSEQNAKRTREAPERLQTLKAELAKPPFEQPPVVPPDATLVQVQQLLSQAETAFSDAQKSLQILQDEPKRRADRRLEIPKLVEAAKLQLAEIDKQLEAKPSPDEPAESVAAARLLLESRKQALNAEIAASQVELQFFEATGELLSAQRDRAARRQDEAETQVKALRTLVNESRRRDALQQAMEAFKTSAQAHPAVRKIADANAELAQLRQTLADKIENTTEELEQIDQQVSALDNQFKKVANRYKTVGATESVGLLLRKQRAELPNLELHRRRIKQRSIDISDVYMELIEAEEKRNDLATLDQNVKAILNSLGATVGSEREFLGEEIRNVLEAQQKLYDSLIADTNIYLDNLVELDVRQQELISRSREFAEYCDERILWIRSTTGLSISHVRQLAPSLLWLTSRENWSEVGRALWSDVLNHPALTSIAVLLFVLLVVVQPHLRRTTTQLGEQAMRSNIISYLPTLRAFFTTGLQALLWPGLMGYVGLRLSSSESGSDFVGSIGYGLKATAVVFGTVELFRQVCRRRGLGQAHFDWSEGTLSLIRSTTWWFMACGLPLILIVTVTEAQPGEAIKNSLGRIAFVGTLAVLMVCVHRVMRPVGGAFESIYAANPQAWTSRMQQAWHALSLSVPLSLGGLALSGYYYTAFQLAFRLLATLWLVSGLLIVHAALIRWSLLSYRALAMRQNRERRAEAAAAAGPAASAAPTPGKVQPEFKLSDINKQTRKLLQLGLVVGLTAGLWLVWGDVLPALGALRHVELWMVESTTTSGSTTTTVMQPITLANVLLAAMIALLTFAAGRNLPGLLEITILQRLPLDPGARYAITTVCKYAITAAGLVSAFGVIGIGWSKVQWLVAAIGVGLGFGLQEIFANFVSGLILLFERPVRLGDIVTVGEVTGQVTRIQMRATTITDWDMRELVVPNKEFITGRLMNWTLSSTVSRMSIAIGVAYGTDPDIVRKLLMQIATRHPLVLKDPPPHALFDDFAVSTLNFVLRVYMAKRDVYIDLRHSLLTEIATEFNQAGIEIAFPQQDIHIRSAVPLSSPIEQNGRDATTSSKTG